MTHGKGDDRKAEVQWEGAPEAARKCPPHVEQRRGGARVQDPGRNLFQAIQLQDTGIETVAMPPAQADAAELGQLVVH